MIIIKGMYEILMLPRFCWFTIIVWQKNAVWVPGLNQPIRLNSNLVPVDERLGEKASGLNEDPVLREVAVGVVSNTAHHTRIMLFSTFLWRSLQAQPLFMQPSNATDNWSGLRRKLIF